MRLIAIILFFCIAATCGCKKNEPFPDCLNSLIETLKNSASCQTGKSIKEFKFQGAIVYLSDSGNCYPDGTAAVIDENCQYLGSLGGFTGNTKINGVEFSTAVYIRTIWAN